MGLTQEQGGSGFSSALAQHVDKSSSIETEAGHLRSLKIEHSLEDFRQATWTKRLKTKEWGTDVQVKRRGDFQAKYPSPPHSMHCTNSTSRINGKMTPK